MLKGSKM